MSKPYTFSPLLQSVEVLARLFLGCVCRLPATPVESPRILLVPVASRTVSKKTGSRRSWYKALCERAQPDNAPTFSKPGLFPWPTHRAAGSLEKL
jgi:hypothetical protein